MTTRTNLSPVRSRASAPERQGPARDEKSMLVLELAVASLALLACVLLPQIR